MTTSPVRVERRVGQRFSYLLPVALRQSATSVEGFGFTQDLSSRGVFLFTDAALTEGAEVELTLRMPSEITLGESMPVRCRGRVLRILRPTPSNSSSSGASKAETKIGVAVLLEGYEYLPEIRESYPTLARVSALHSQDEEPSTIQPSARS